MNFRKRVIAVAAVIAMTALVMHGSTMEMSGVNQVRGRLSWIGQKDTLYFWYADEELTDYLSSAAVTFGEKEGVRVIPVLASDSEYLEAINQASLQGEQTPDVYLLSSDALEKAYLSGLAGKVRDKQNICNEEHFPQAALSTISYKGNIIAYPLFFETSALVYNETYLAEWAKQQAMKELAGGDEDTEPAENTDAATLDETLLAQKTEEYLVNGIPKTMNDILNIADTFDLPEGVEGVMEWDVSDIFYNYWFVGEYMILGGDAGDDENDMNIDNAETIQCLEFYKSLNEFFSIESDTVSYDAVIQNFIDGKTVFTIGTTDVVERLEAAKADGSFLYDYGIAMMPDVSDELKSRSLSVTNVAVINGYSTNKDLANKFASFLADEYTQELYQWTGKVSANLNANTENGALQMFAAEYAKSVTLPKMMETGNFWLRLEVLFSKVWNGEDVPTAVRELANQMTVQTQVETSENTGTE